MRPHMLVAVAILGALAGCQSEQKPIAPPSAPKVAAEPKVEAKSYRLKGVVREVNAKDGIVTIAHEELPGFMKAMTMDFTPKDKSIFEEVGVGDEVEGPLEVRMEGKTVKDYNLLSLEVTQPAPRTLSLTANGLAITTKPAVLTPGETVPDFKMTTQEGKPLALSDLKGKLVVLTFIYTRCPLPDYCPAVDKKFRQVRDGLKLKPERADATRIVSVSFDPEHDTPETLKKHGGLQGANPPYWTFAVASHPELAKVGPKLGLIYGPMPNEIRHNIVIALIGADGKLIKLESGRAGMDWSANDILNIINKELTKTNK